MNHSRKRSHYASLPLVLIKTYPPVMHNNHGKTPHAQATSCQAEVHLRNV